MRRMRLTPMIGLIAITILMISFAACASEPPEPEIVRETVEVPVTVEVTREIVEVQEVEVTRQVEVEIDVTRLMTKEVEVTRLVPLVTSDYLAGGVWTVGPYELAFIDDGTWIVPHGASETFRDVGSWRIEENAVHIRRTEGPCAGTSLTMHIDEIHDENRFHAVVEQEFCAQSIFGTAPRGSGNFSRLELELPAWAAALLAEREE